MKQKPITAHKLLLMLGLWWGKSFSRQFPTFSYEQRVSGGWEIPKTDSREALRSYVRLQTAFHFFRQQLQVSITSTSVWKFRKIGFISLNPKLKKTVSFFLASWSSLYRTLSRKDATTPSWNLVLAVLEKLLYALPSTLLLYSSWLLISSSI